MKKIIFITVLAISLLSCGKSNVELEIEEYDLKTAKLEYLNELLDTKEDLAYKERMRLIDSLLNEEKERINNDNNN